MQNRIIMITKKNVWKKNPKKVHKNVHLGFFCPKLFVFWAEKWKKCKKVIFLENALISENKVGRLLA